MSESKAETQTVGVSITDFSAGVETLVELRDDHRYLIYLIKDHWVNFIGDLDNFSVELTKKIKGKPVDRKFAEQVMDEIKIYLQTVLATGSPQEAKRILCAQFYDDEIEEFEKQKRDPSILTKVVEDKAEMVFKFLRTTSLVRKRRRAANTPGPILCDIDVDTISNRYVGGEPQRNNTPLINLHLKYLDNNQGFTLPYPPWASSFPHNSNKFSLECDEGELDLMIMRLTLAKSLLAKSIQESAKLNLDEPSQK